MSPTFGVPEVAGLESPEQIGRGAFSVVFRAYQPQFSRFVALKVLDVDLRDDQARIRFDNECQRLGQLTGHPNIVTVLDSGVLPGRHPYLVMDFMVGGSLDEHVQASGPFPIERVLRTGVKVAGALETAHQSGILHRDIKPSNVLVSRFGEPALADFGISAVADEMMRASFSNYFTPAHAAPEVVDGKPATEESDVYSLCSTLYELLAGHYPFEVRDARTTGNVPALQRRILENPVPPISRPDLPPAFMDLLRRGLSKKPAERPQDCLDLGEELRSIQHTMGFEETSMVVPDASAPAPQVPAPVKKKPGRRTRGKPRPSSAPPPRPQPPAEERAPLWIPTPEPARRPEPTIEPVPNTPSLPKAAPTPTGLVAAVEAPPIAPEEEDQAPAGEPSYGQAAAWIPRAPDRSTESRSSRGSGRNRRSSTGRWTGSASTTRRSSRKALVIGAATALVLAVVGVGAVAAFSGGGGGEAGPVRDRRLDPEDVAISNAAGSATVTWINDTAVDTYLAIYARPSPDEGVECETSGDPLLLRRTRPFGPVACRAVGVEAVVTLSDAELAELAADARGGVVCIGIVTNAPERNRFGESLAPDALRFAPGVPVPTVERCDS
ncbi:MAG: protein kinase domain-containing protein [Microthrixaceae bacterium]